MLRADLIPTSRPSVPKALNLIRHTPARLPHSFPSRVVSDHGLCRTETVGTSTNDGLLLRTIRWSTARLRRPGCAITCWVWCSGHGLWWPTQCRWLWPWSAAKPAMESCPEPELQQRLQWLPGLNRFKKSSLTCPSRILKVNI